MKKTIRKLSLDLRETSRISRERYDEIMALRCKVNDTQLEIKKLKGAEERIQRFVRSVDEVLGELKGIIIGLKLPDDLPKKSINFQPHDYYMNGLSREDKKNEFTVRDEIEARLEFIQNNISSINLR